MPIHLSDTPPANAAKLFVIGGDVHLHVHAYANHINEDGVPNRVAHGIDVLEQGARAAFEHKVPFIINGDLTHNKNSMDPVVTAELDKFFRFWRQKIEFYLIPGNHEKPDKFKQVSTLDVFKAPGVMLVPTPVVLHFNDTSAALVPFAYDHKAQIKELVHTAQLFIGHFPTSGVNLGKHTLQCEVKFEDFHPEKYLALLFNDIHKHQPVGANGYHLGAPMQNNFGEEGYDCGWWLVSRLGETIYLTRIPTKAPTFHYVETEEEAEDLREAGNYVRIRPQVLVKKVMAEQETARINFNVGDMDDTLKNYLRFQVDAGKIPAEDADDILRCAREVM